MILVDRLIIIWHDYTQQVKITDLHCKVALCHKTYSSVFAIRGDSTHAHLSPQGEARFNAELPILHEIILVNYIATDRHLFIYFHLYNASNILIA